MRRWIVLWVLLVTAASGSGAVVPPATHSPLPAFIHPSLSRAPELRDPTRLRAPDRGEPLARLQRLGVAPDRALLEVESGRWGTLLLARPLIPGVGVGNQLTWDDLGGKPQDLASLEAIVERELRGLLDRERSAFGIDPRELDLELRAFEEGALIQVAGRRLLQGVAVRGAHFTAVVNRGNLVLVGSRAWADVRVNAVPTVNVEAGAELLSRFLAPHRIRAWSEEPRLEWVPTLGPAGSGQPRAYDHRLAWVLSLEIEGVGGSWLALIDAHNGEVLLLEDQIRYGAARNIRGGVYPASNDGSPPDGTMIADYPMPFADLDIGGFADSGGNFAAAGAVTTTLNGQFVRILDGCGAIVETSTGDIDLEGTDGDTDCVVPPGHSAGDTAGARTAYYEANRLREQAAGYLPANAWLMAQLTANTNINATCGAFWNGTSLNFYRNNAGPCANTAEMAGVIGHEWAHGLDDNDVNGSITSNSQGGPEGSADLIAALRGNISCIGRGFFTAGSPCGGYGDPCTAESGCTGVRTVDYADRQSGLPHTLSWARANCINDDGGHCKGAAYSEAVWDLYTRDLPTVYGMDTSTALEVTTRLMLIAGGNLSGWFDFSGPDPGDAGCGAGQAYFQFLATDDDDGDIGNGTPHMTAIAAAFDRLEVGCTPGGATPGPTVQDSGCSPNPSVAPVVAAVATPQGADLSWAAVPDAASYSVYRGEGERECELGKTLAGSTTGLTFSDSGLQDGRAYYYVVIPFGAGGATCFGPASACTTVGNPNIFADGFESGDTSAWSVTVP